MGLRHLCPGFDLRPVVGVEPVFVTVVEIAFDLRLVGFVEHTHQVPTVVVGAEVRAVGLHRHPAGLPQLFGLVQRGRGEAYVVFNRSFETCDAQFDFIERLINSHLSRGRRFGVCHGGYKSHSGFPMICL